MHLQLDRFPGDSMGKDLHNTGKFRSICSCKSSLPLNFPSLCFHKVIQRLSFSGAESSAWDRVLSPPLLKRDWIHFSKAKSAARDFHDL